MTGIQVAEPIKLGGATSELNSDVPNAGRKNYTLIAEKVNFKGVDMRLAAGYKSITRN